MTYVTDPASGDWASLYIDGNKEWEHHSLDVDDLSAIVKNKLFTLEVIHERCTNDLYPCYPDKLEELVGKRGKSRGRG